MKTVICQIMFFFFILVAPCDIKFVSNLGILINLTFMKIYVYKEKNEYLKTK